LKKRGVIVLLWGHGDEGRLLHEFKFTDEYQAAVFIGCDAGSVNKRIAEGRQLPRSRMDDGKIWRGGTDLNRFYDKDHAEYWDQIAIDDAKRKADEWFRDPNGPKEVKFIFVRAEDGYGRCRIHTLTPQNLGDEIKLPGWQNLKLRRER
jgi:hypothetical protein